MALRSTFSYDEKTRSGGYRIVTSKLRPRTVTPPWARDPQSILTKLALTPRVKENIQIATWYYIEGWNCDDIAKEIGISPGAVRGRLYHIRRVK